MPDPTFDALKGEYARLWHDMEILPSRMADIMATARKIVAKKSRYQAVEKAVGVPWYVVGVMHAMESGCNFATHLHNGDELAKGRTTHEPKNRPKAPPEDGKTYSWKESACDALTMKGLQNVTDWPVERIAYELERYNGFGYRKYHPSVLTPYLWSYTNSYARGKYVEDGEWDAEAVSAQSGAMALLKECIELDADVKAELYVSDVPPALAIADVNPSAEFRKAEPPSPVIQAVKSSRTIFGIVGTAISLIVYVYNEAVSVLLAAYAQYEALAPTAKLLSALGISVASISLITAFASLGGAFFARLDDAHKGANVK